MNNPLNIDIDDLLDLDNLPLERQKSLKEKMGYVLYKSITIRIVEVLNDKEKEEFEKLLDKGGSPNDINELINFLDKNVPNINEIIEEEVSNFKEESKKFVDGLE